MASHNRVYNQTQNCYWKRNQAFRAVENCAAEWVNPGVSVRDLTLAESIAARIAQVQARQPLPWAELPQCIYRPPESSLWSVRSSAMLCRITNHFAISV